MDGSWWRVLTKFGPLEKEMANHFSILALRTPWTVWKGKKIGHWEMNSPGWWVPNMLLEISGEITPERMKRQSQGRKSTQLWMWLVIKARSYAIKSNIAWEPGMLGPCIKAIWKWSNRKWQPTPVFVPGGSQGWGSLVGCHLWGRIKLDTTEVT